MIRWDLATESLTAPFFVTKSEDGLALRCLFNGRAANCGFVDPPSVDLLSGEGLTHAHVPSSETHWGSGYDFVDYYNGVRTPSWIASRLGSLVLTRRCFWNLVAGEAFSYLQALS